MLASCCADDYCFVYLEIRASNVASSFILFNEEGFFVCVEKQHGNFDMYFNTMYRLLWAVCAFK